MNCDCVYNEGMKAISHTDKIIVQIYLSVKVKKTLLNVKQCSNDIKVCLFQHIIVVEI